MACGNTCSCAKHKVLLWGLPHDKVPLLPSFPWDSPSILEKHQLICHLLGLYTVSLLCCNLCSPSLHACLEMTGTERCFGQFFGQYLAHVQVLDLCCSSSHVLCPVTKVLSMELWYTRTAVLINSGYNSMSAACTCVICYTSK